jgi:hypothetical protein
MRAPYRRGSGLIGPTALCGTDARNAAQVRADLAGTRVESTQVMSRTALPLGTQFRARLADWRPWHL